MNLLKHHSYSKSELLILSLGLTILAGILLNLGQFLILLLPFKQISILHMVFLGALMIVSFIIIPYCLIKIFIGFTINPLSRMNFTKLIIYFFLIIIIGSIFSFSLTDIFQSIIVSFSEETLFRLFIFAVLMSKFSKWQSIILGSLIFSLLLHLNGSFIENLLIKFPCSILLYLIAHYKGLENSILLHCVYNILIIKITI
ncbi:CPBP family intramembrane glutamic endopeptidase [Staphylococcus gallinarum]|uniref:CPBP family intramembrane glutamic endopeptidase n=1 Tax=Staphylococcus gallinarum TaxID=1293 RepID=UPI001E5E4D14|nr:CPBP family intramembrane glutamic endopeptidase [Staphylococcus gallinarum]MCD8858502.1 CPBP family intramembrane metalloprotease [Staphylococcus gallinarum]MEB7038897.1 CPBP family intramembrane metalloprotease [Staphylococcus gallinarum]